MKKKIVVAVDGYAACGKSTLAKGLAKELDYLYIDSGAMYRAVTLYFIENHIDWKNPYAVSRALNEIEIRFQQIKGENITLLNGKIVETEIRGMEVSQLVSDISAISAVRRAMVAQQREMGSEMGVVMDGRDIGTVVFPNAELKIFLNARMEIRVQRRLDELKAKGIIIHASEIERNLELRDFIDSTRDDSPLKKAGDAIEIDNSHLEKEEQLKLALKLARERIREKESLQN